MRNRRAGWSNQFSSNWKLAVVTEDMRGWLYCRKSSKRYGELKCIQAVMFHFNMDHATNKSAVVNLGTAVRKLFGPALGKDGSTKLTLLFTLVHDKNNNRQGSPDIVEAAYLEIKLGLPCHLQIQQSFHILGPSGWSITHSSILRGGAPYLFPSRARSLSPYVYHREGRSVGPELDPRGQFLASQFAFFLSRRPLILL